MEKPGMVVKIIGDSCILLTSEGEYLKVPLPVNGVTRVGQMITHVEKKKSFPYLRYFAVAASLLLIVLVGQLYLGRMQPAAAFVTIDINPSIELAVSADRRVASARGLNSDGVMILEEVKVKGLDLHEAVKLIVAQAVTDQFLAPKEDNIILVTLTTNSDGESLVDLESIYESVKSPVELNGLETEVIIEPVDTAVRQEAEKAGISTGRYLLLQKTAEKGVTFNAGEINAMGLGKLQKEKKISIIELLSDDGDNNDNDDNGSPNDKNPVVKKAARKGIYRSQQNLKENNSDSDKKADYSTGREKSNSDGGKTEVPGHNEKKDIDKKKAERKQSRPD